MYKPVPNLFIVGAPKCGTTSMWYYLGQHPDVFMIKEKEPQFFNDDLAFKNRPSAEQYQNMFSSSKGERYLGEASPLYLISKFAAKNIHQYSPEARIIIMLRKPNELLNAIFLQNRVNHVEPLETFEEALNAEFQRRNSLKGTINGQPVERLFYSEFVNYVQQIRRFYQYFDNDKIHIILFDELKSNTKGAFEEVCKFLNLRTCDKINFDIQNKAKVNRSEVIQSFIDKPPRIIKKIGRTLVSDQLRSKLYWKMWWLNKKNIDNSTSVKDPLGLNKKYLKNIEDLEVLLNKDLKQWKS